jgi:hypothetical protein
MKREIQISQKIINGIVLLVVVIVLIGVGFLLVHRNPALLSRIFSQAVATPTQVDPKSAPDAQAAVKALIAFYTLDYTETVDQWQGRVCALTTQGGCQIIQAFFAPIVRKVVDANQVKTGCTVQAVRMVQDKGDSRTWLVEVTLDKPWPGEKPTLEVYAEVARINGNWLLNSILFDQEAAARFATPASSFAETSTPTH